MRFRTLPALLACVAVIGGGAPAAFAQPAPGAQTELLAARATAPRSAQAQALAAWKARHPGHVLEPYADLWMLGSPLQDADPSAVKAFLDRHAEGPLAEALRRDWLKVLGANGDWEAFRAEYPRLSADDAQVTCHALQDRLARGDAAAAGEARALFAAARETPPNCDAVFAGLVADRRIAEDAVWERIRRLLALNLTREAKRANALLPASHALGERRLDSAAANPARYLAREKGALPARSTREVVVYALTRLARNHPDEAAERLEQFAARLGADATRFAWGQVAYQSAMNHHPRTLEFYRLAGEAPLTETQAAWKARAALRGGLWKDVLGAIQSLPPQRAREPGWRYWRARALRELGEPAAADGLLKGLARELDFYGLLAAGDLGQEITPQWDRERPAQADLERMRAVPGIQRALALYRMGLDNEALREWIWALRGREDRDLLAAAEVARLADEPARAINTADRTVQVHDFAQRYPIPHRDVLGAAARQWDLDEALVYSIIRQESRFVPEARSRAGAAGLMQLMPATARWVARQIPLQPFRREMLARPDVNIRMGSYYLRRVLDELGHPILAAAAYNAGPGRARRWRHEQALEGAIYAETIPFDETRDYVKKVFANAWFYQHRLHGKARSLRERLGMVPGRAADGDAAVAALVP
jgi:soluble lytic murein transglycosylase